MSRLIVFMHGSAIEAAACCWGDCELVGAYRLATPIGDLDYCFRHIDEVIASLPPDWIAQWATPAPVEIPESDDGIPF